MRLAPVLFLASACLAQRPAVTVTPGTARCHAYAVNMEQATQLVRLLDEGKISPEEAQTRALKSEKRLGDFEAVSREEETTTRSFDLPGTALKVTVTVFFTDESMPLRDSVWMGLVAGPKAAANAIQTPGAAITETNLTSETYRLLVKSRTLLQGKPWLLGAECQFKSDAEPKRGAAVPPARN